MTPSEPRSWSNRRGALAATTLVLLGLAVGLSGHGFAMFLALATLLIVLDAVMVSLRVRGAADRATLEMTVAPRGGVDTFLVGGEIELSVLLRTTRPLTGILLTPIVPPGLELRHPLAHVGTLPAGVTWRGRYTLAIAAPGLHAFPGLRLRLSSPLGFFARTRLLTRRVALTALPDQVQSTSPNLQRLMRILATDSRSRNVVRHTGSDFHELREYRYPDSFRRIDWKATARRSEVMVREYETPRELTVRVLLDGSIDLACHERWFANSLELIAHLVLIATSFHLDFRVSLYDERVLRNLDRGIGMRGAWRMLSELAAAPALALRRKASDPRHDECLREKATSLARRLGWSQSEPLDEFLQRYEPQGRDPRRALAHFVAELDPNWVQGLADRCEACGQMRFPDEARCAVCTHPFGLAGLTPRAGCVAGWLSETMRATRGREVIIFISALLGGESCPPNAKMLRLARRGYRSVHVIVPNFEQLRDRHPDHPKSLGHQPALPHVVGNIDKLHAAEQFASFRRTLHGAGIELHSIDDRLELEGVVEHLLHAELHAADSGGARPRAATV